MRVEINRIGESKMIKAEFEKMAMRHDKQIGVLMYDSIELFYMSDTEYHQYNGGIDETKREFVSRVFGGKCNTPNTIAVKIAHEAIRENRWALRGNRSADKRRLDEMDTLILNHYNGLLKYGM
jgi:hypothetical protein